MNVVGPLGPQVFGLSRINSRQSLGRKGRSVTKLPGQFKFAQQQSFLPKLNCLVVSSTLRPLRPKAGNYGNPAISGRRSPFVASVAQDDAVPKASPRTTQDDAVPKASPRTTQFAVVAARPSSQKVLCASWEPGGGSKSTDQPIKTERGICTKTYEKF